MTLSIVGEELIFTIPPPGLLAERLVATPLAVKGKGGAPVLLAPEMVKPEKIEVLSNLVVTTTR